MTMTQITYRRHVRGSNYRIARSGVAITSPAWQAYRLLRVREGR